LLRITGTRFFRGFGLSFGFVISSFSLLFTISEFFFQISWGRDEDAGRGIVGNPVGTVAASGSILWDCVSRSIPTHAVQGIQVQIFIPGAGEPKSCVSSGPRSRMAPLTEPPAGTKKPLGEAAEILRHRFPRPEALKDPDRCFWELAKMPVDNLHMCDPGKQGGDVVLYGPGDVRIGNRILGQELRDVHLRALLGIQEQPYGKIKRNRLENKPTRK
jgi:hypothetical protein